MAGIEDWQAAAPEGQRVAAAAPLRAPWQRTSTYRDGLLLVVIAVICYVTARAGLLPDYPPSALLIVFGLWMLVRHRFHRRPEGMAAWVTMDRVEIPVLLVTEADVLMTEMAEPRFLRTPPRPLGPGQSIPGLTSIDAVRNRLVLTFADGSTATFRLREPKRGAAARFATWAAPVLEGSRHRTAPQSTAS